MMKVSFVVPVYNAKRFLAETLDSILNQTHNNIEVVCVNDASTDSSGEILSQYALKDARMRIVNAECNKGVSCARNLGFQYVTGEFIWFFDSDDLIHPNAVKFALAAIDKYGADFSYTPIERIAENVSYEDCMASSHAYIMENMPYATDPFRCFKGNYFGLQHCLVKKSLLDDIRFLPGLKYGEDRLFLTQLLAKSPKCVYLPFPFVYYRQHSESACHSLGNDKIKDSLKEVVRRSVDLLRTDVPDELRSVVGTWLKKKGASEIPEKTERKTCFCVAASDNVRMKSSSGGVFPVLACEYVSRGGAVAGAVYSDDWTVKYELAKSLDGVDKMRGSKYVRSTLDKNFIDELESELERGGEVLFVGVPCQVAAMRKKFGDREKLLLVDLICHGAPDARFWKIRLEELKIGNKKIIDINFRDKSKERGLTSSVFSVFYSDGTHYAQPLFKDPYGLAFGSDLLLSKSCSCCPYACQNRVGDITIGDFWDLVGSEHDDGKGLSCVIINSDKGRRAFDLVEKNFKFVHQYPTSVIQQPNFHSPSRPHPLSAAFQKKILSRVSTFDEAVSEFYRHEKAIGILNFHWENRNFGAVLTSYALSKYLSDIGWYPCNIDYSPVSEDSLAMRPNPLFEAFRSRYIPRTKRISDLKKIPWNLFQTLMVGSDQVWSAELTKGNEDVFFLSAAGWRHRLIAASASFGRVPAALRNRKELRARLGIFDSLGIRESEDAETVHGLCGKGECISDPVFWVDIERWNELASPARDFKGKVVVYNVMHSQRERLFGFLAQTGLTSVERPAYVINSTLSPEEWLAAIRDSEMLVTDSFHGVCFAIMFHTPFVCINDNEQASKRHCSLLTQLGLLHRFFSDEAVAVKNYRELSAEKWDVIDDALMSFRRNGREFIEKALSSTIPQIRSKAWLRLDGYNRGRGKLKYLKNVGRIWVVRKMLGGARCLKENGWRYTLDHLLRKIKRKIKKLSACA